MKIYTKTGDSGNTGLYGGTRISKASARVEAYGTVDELNAFIGVAVSEIGDASLKNQLQKIQFHLFTLGGEVATPPDKLVLANGKPRLPVTITEKETTDLETWMDAMDQVLQPLQYFILPGGGKGAALLHAARTVCRRAERCMVFLNEEEAVRPELIKFLNRLSDYFFIAARYMAMLNAETEHYWNPAAQQSESDE